MKLLLSIVQVFMIVGFPRIWGTEVPMALFLVPFHVKSLVSLYSHQVYLLNFIVLILTSWIALSTMSSFMGTGGYSDYFFFLSLAFKFALNLTCGLILYLLLEKSKDILNVWIVTQFFIIVLTSYDLEIYKFFLGFISPRSADVFIHVFGLRTLGFGLFHVDGAYLLIAASLINLLITRFSKVSYVLWFLSLIFALSLARSGLVSYLIFSLLIIGYKLKRSFIFNLIFLFIFSLFVSSGPFYEATSIFRLNQSGNSVQTSVLATENMYKSEITFNEALVGSGKFFEANTAKLEFFKNTDVGYLRILFYAGFVSLLLFVLLNVLIILPGFLAGSENNKRISLSLLFIFLVLNLKGLQIINVFSVIPLLSFRLNKNDLLFPKG